MCKWFNMVFVFLWLTSLSMIRKHSSPKAMLKSSPPLINLTSSIFHHSLSSPQLPKNSYYSFLVCSFKHSINLNYDLVKDGSLRHILISLNNKHSIWYMWPFLVDNQMCVNYVRNRKDVQKALSDSHWLQQS